MDDQTPFKMPPFTGRNILIFSDGTGQATDRYQESRRSVLPDKCAPVKANGAARKAP